MKSLTITIFILCLYSNLFGQDSIVAVRRYLNNFPLTAVDSFYHQSNNTLFISLNEGFDDSLYVTINDVPILNKYLKTNESIGYAGGFGVYFKDSSERKTLKIKFVGANRYIHEDLNLKYKSLQIGKYESWTLIYTNRFPMRE